MSTSISIPEVISSFNLSVKESVLDKDALRFSDKEETEITEEDDLAEAEWFFMERNQQRLYFS